MNFDENLIKSSSLSRGLGEQVDGDDQSVETQDFSENQDQDHSDEQARLLGCSSHTCVTNDSDCEACSKTGEAHRQSSAEMHEASERKKKLGLFGMQ